MITQQQVQELKEEFEESMKGYNYFHGTHRNFLGIERPNHKWVTEIWRRVSIEEYGEEFERIKQTARDYLKEVEKGCGEVYWGKNKQGNNVHHNCGQYCDACNGYVLCPSCQKLKDDLMEIING